LLLYQPNMCCLFVNEIIASPATSVDVYRTNIALKLQQNNTANGILDTLFTVNYRVMLTGNYIHIT
jgi:hypothetical protein